MGDGSFVNRGSASLHRLPVFSTSFQDFDWSRFVNRWSVTPPANRVISQTYLCVQHSPEGTIIIQAGGGA